MGSQARAPECWVSRNSSSAASSIFHQQTTGNSISSHTVQQWCKVQAVEQGKLCQAQKVHSAARPLPAEGTAAAHASTGTTSSSAAPGAQHLLNPAELTRNVAAAAGAAVVTAAQLHANLLGAHGLLQRVSHMGPLLSLIKAYSVRDEFLRVNKDIVNTFGILAAGEQLLVSPLPSAMPVTAAEWLMTVYDGFTCTMQAQEHAGAC